ncbi:MAG: energy transducer TonB [Gammaproteobacteria bacterium]|nr:energy transducer TonB [Gammaproteobacteria bacterium]
MNWIQTNSFVLLTALTLSNLASGDDAVEKFDSDTDRVPLLTTVPDYPEVARRDRIQGEVQVCFNITRDGYPRRIAVRSSSNRLFEKPAMKAVRKSTWVRLDDDQAMSGIKACRTFRFSLVPVEKDEDQS